jgi:hypothetical protein
MTHDPRTWAQGGQEYAPAPASAGPAQPYNPPHVGEVYAQPGHQAPYQAPQPAVRPAPAGYEAAPAAPPAPRPAPPAAAAAAGGPVVTLTRPYQAHDVDVQSVRFRKPTTKDLRKCGYPMRNATNANGVPVAMEELPDVVARYVSALSDPPLPPSTVDQFELEDFSRCSAVILGFFLG